MQRVQRAELLTVAQPASMAQVCWLMAQSRYQAARLLQQADCPCAQVFSFPTLSEADLLSCLRDMELPLTAAQLAKPAPEFIVPLYETFVTTLGGVSRRVSVACVCRLCNTHIPARACR